VAEAILTVDEQGTIVSANSAVRRLFGRSPEELGGQAATALVEPKRAAALVAHLAAHRAGQEASAGGFETVGLRRDGSTFPMDLLVAATQSGERRLFVLSFRDTTEQRAQMDALEYRALHDPLTGLPNRTLFADRLGQALQMAARQDLPFAVLVLDLDDFKDVNDELGHDAGDRLLAQASDRLRSACRAADTVARLGGDEFAVLMGPVADGPNAPALARKMLHALGHPFEVAGGLVRVRASIGIARYPEHAADAGALLRCADAAMYAAKRSGEGFAVYRPELERAGDSSLLMFGRGGT
jgi:diguanylate cyclase (GGDEF)-like protein/PAS domain S-box-containing protein